MVRVCASNHSISLPCGVVDAGMVFPSMKSSRGDFRHRYRPCPRSRRHSGGGRNSVRATVPPGSDDRDHRSTRNNWSSQIRTATTTTTRPKCNFRWSAVSLPSPPATSAATTTATTMIADAVIVGHRLDDNVAASTGQDVTER